MKILLQKDFRMFFGGDKPLKNKIISAIIKTLFILCVIGIIVFMLTGILNKIKIYDGANEAFMSFCLEIVSIILILSNTIRANKLFYNHNDISLTSKYPIKSSSIILSKLIFLFVTYYYTAIIFTYPMLVAYGIISNLSVGFYFIAFLYPLFTFFFDIGIALLLLIPYNFIKKRLKSYFILRFVLYLAAFILFSILYSLVLSVYIELVAGGDLFSLFTKDTINKFQMARMFEIPASPFIGFAVENELWNLLLILVNLCVFAFGTTLSIIYYNHSKDLSHRNKPIGSKTKYKSQNSIICLIKKELSILSKNDNYIVSFMCLLIIQPFLAYLIIYALNMIFRTGNFAYYISIVPNFIPLLDIFVLILFTLIINQGATNYIQMEEKTITIMKTIPISYKKQILTKVSIPFVLSFISFIVTDIVLLLTNVIKLDTYFVSIVLVGLILFIYDVICLYEELRIRSNRKRSYFISGLYSYSLPTIYFITSIILSCVGLNIALIYLIGILLMAILGIYFIYDAFKNIDTNFTDIEQIRKSYE